MNVNFNRLYRKTVTLACITAVLISVAATLIPLGAMLVLLKTVLPDLPVWSPYVAAAAGLAISAPITFLILKPSQLKLSKQLDAEHDLKESVQTMVVFDGQDGSMLELQREQADTTLSKLRPKKHLVKRIIIPAIALLLGVALTVAGLVIPAPEKEPANDDSKEPDEPFAITEYQIGALRALIEDVEDMSCDEAVRSATVAELTRLLDVLMKTTSKNAMEDEVTATMLTVDLYVESASTYKILAVEIFQANDSYAKAIARELLNYNGRAFSQYMSKLRDEFKEDTVITYEDPSKDPVIITLEEKITSLSIAFDTTVPASSVANKNDKLLLALTAFASSFKNASSANTPEEMQSLFDKAFSAAGNAAWPALDEQYGNKVLCKTVTQTLSDIFGVEIPELLSNIEPELISSGESDGEGGSDKESSGGYGEGNELYGSSDKIFDPFHEDGAKYVIYGESFDDYYKRIEDMLIDSNLSEETKQILIGYFAALSDGTKTGK